MSVMENLIEEMHTTLTGKSEWAKILTPDYTHDKEGKYAIDLILNPGDVDCILMPMRKIVSLKAQLEGATDFAPPPFNINPETKIHTFRFRQDAVARPAKGEPFKLYVDVFDARKNPWPKDVRIGNGSLVKVCFTLWPWNVKPRGGVGVTMHPRAVQVINHIPYEPEEKDYGFQQEEGTDMGTGPGAGEMFPAAGDKNDIPLTSSDPVVAGVPF